MPDTHDLYATYEQIGNQFIAVVRVPWFSKGRPLTQGGEVQKFSSALQAQIKASQWLCELFRNQTTGWRETPLCGQISAQQEFEKLFSKGVKS